jgi:putative aldouronate transport system substrate-binding protein
VQTGIQTYSDELCIKLAQGTASLDDFDSYLEELKELGLDELIAVQQARYDRFVQSRN